jgi:hypothetical protein
MRAAFNVMMRIVSTLLGVVMIAMGTVWILQGTRLGVPVRVHGWQQALGPLWRDPCAARHRTGDLEQYAAGQKLISENYR